jgi:hypothetical protein
MSSNDDEFEKLRTFEARQKANILMEQALELLDITKEYLTAAKLDDAICSLGFREDKKNLNKSPHQK